MAKIIPFNGMQYDKDVVSDLAAVTTPPYDIISPAQQQEFYNVHPFNVIRLELGMEQPDDDETNNKYTRSGETLDEWLESGILTMEDEPAIYIYGQEFTLKNGKTLSYKGITCLVKLEEFEKGIILPHEETLSKAKNDRFNLMKATGANFSSIYSLYLDSEKNITSVIDKIATTQNPETVYTACDGVKQKLWKIKDADVIGKIQSDFADKQLFIADGHHRYETALNFRNYMREKNPTHTGNELYNYIMMFLVEMDEPGLVVFPTHRMVKNVANYDENEVVKALSDEFDVQKIESKENISESIEQKLGENNDKKVFAMYTGKDYYYYLTLRSADSARQANPGRSEAYQMLDVTILHSLILDKIMGIGEQSMKDQLNLVYTRDPKEAEVEVAKGTYQCAFYLNPTKIHEIKEVSLANEKMPQKSTYFYPKLITGLIMNKFQ